MASSQADHKNRIVVDSIHGDIHLTDREWRIVDTPTFQRLRYIKQLGMGHLTYPNATHTRFAHSLGVFGIMQRILSVAEEHLDLPPDQQEDLRFAALLHDVGHYPYSHLTEGVDNVQLIEEIADGVDYSRQLDFNRYPSHEKLGRLIVTHQQDLIEAIGGKRRAKAVADLFGRTGTADPQLSKLVNSSLDMDRMDYLLRDANATGAPYGQIDINYLLNSVEVSPKGMVGVSEKALPAAEQFLFARYFMHLTVYYHKTTYGFEEATRQLLRRIRDSKPRDYGLPKDGQDVRELVTSSKLQNFTDAFVDRIIQQATEDDDDCIKTLAQAIRSRRPPKLLKEVAVLEQSGSSSHTGTTFKQNCKFKITKLAKDHDIPLNYFMFCETRQLFLEKRGAKISVEEAKKLPPEEADELIKVFQAGKDEPVSMVDIEHSLINKCAGHFFQAIRLYVVPDENLSEEKVANLRNVVKNWDSPG